MRAEVSSLKRLGVNGDYLKETLSSKRFCIGSGNESLENFFTENRATEGQRKTNFT